MQPLGSSDDSDIEKSSTEITNPDVHFETLRGCALHSLKDSFAAQSFSFYTFRTYTRKHPLYKDVSHFRAVRKHKLLTSTPKSFLLPFCLRFSCNNTSEIISDTQTGEVKRHLCGALPQLSHFVHCRLSFH